MQNLQLLSRTALSLPPCKAPYYTSPNLYTLTDTHLHIYHFPTPTHSTHSLSHGTHIASLTPHILLSTRSGSLYLFNPAEKSLDLVADIHDENPARSGILALSSTTDGSLCAVLSPVKCILLDGDIELVAEIEHGNVCSDGAMSWSGDGEEVVIVMNVEGWLKGYIMNKNGGRRELEGSIKVEGKVVVDWEKRMGGGIYVSVGDGQVYVYERNGLRFVRADFQVGEEVEGMRWNKECTMLMTWGKEVRIWMKKNWKWYCKLKFEKGQACWTEYGFIMTGNKCWYAEMGMQVQGGSRVGVLNDDRVYWTDFKRGILPPPLFHEEEGGGLVLGGEGGVLYEGEVRGESGKWRVGGGWRGGVVGEGRVWMYDDERVVVFDKEGEVGRVEVNVRCMARSVAGVVVAEQGGQVVEIDEEGREVDRNVGGRDVVEVREVSEGVVVVREKDGGLKVGDVEISTECSSMGICGDMLVYTTYSNLLYCVGVRERKEWKFAQPNLPCLMEIIGGEGVRGGAVRPIDRGSIIVWGGEKVVLQAPRGNLECVLPRPVVWERVAERVKKGEWGRAFEICRRERVDMNHIVDVDFEGFVEGIEQFVKEVGEGLPIFVMGLTGGNVERVCEEIVKVASGRGVLCALVRLGRIEEAVNRVKEEGGVEYLKVLVKDEKRVYEEALGTYDLEFAKGVASGLDPGEVARELKQLGGMQTLERKFKVDCRLGRFDRAVKWLFEDGKLDECLEMCLQYELFKVGLQLFEEGERRVRLLKGYAGYLYRENKFEEAAGMYVRCGDWEGAFESYREAGMWQAAVAAAAKEQEEERRAKLEGLAQDLVQRGEVCAAGRVLAVQLGEIEEAVEVLCGGGEWMTALEILGMKGGEGLWKVFEGLVEEGAKELMEMLRENRIKMKERAQRLSVVREMKRGLAERLGGVEEDAFSSTTASSVSSTLSDVTFVSKSSVTSLYTTKESETGVLSKNKMDKIAERRKRREGRKRIREGHPREEEALVGYLRKLIPGNKVGERVEHMVRVLTFLGKDGGKVIEEFREFENEVEKLPEDVREGVERWRGGFVEIV